MAFRKCRKTCNPVYLTNLLLFGSNQGVPVPPGNGNTGLLSFTCVGTDEAWDPFKNIT